MKNVRLNSHRVSLHPPLEKLDCGHWTSGTDPKTHYCNIIKLQDLPLKKSTRCLHPDEPLFVGVHQMCELVFTQMLGECRRLVTALDADDAVLAISIARRLTQLANTLTPVTRLLGTIKPADFALLRSIFGHASGADSIQFRAVEILAGLREASYRKFLEAELGDSRHGRFVRWTEDLETLWQSRSVDEAARDLLARHGTNPLAVLNSQFGESAHEAVIYELCESLLDFDEAFALWRTSHARVVERMIGPHAQGSGYSVGVRYLDESTRRRRFFSSFWNARSELMSANANELGSDQRNGEAATPATPPKVSTRVPEGRIAMLNTAAMKVGVDVQSVLDAVDALDVQGFLNHLTEECEFRAGGAPPIVGHDTIATSVQGLFALTTSIKHNVDNVWRHANHVIVRGTAVYHRKVGEPVSLPFVDIWVVLRNKIASYTIYSDLGSLANS